MPSPVTTRHLLNWSWKKYFSFSVFSDLYDWPELMLIVKLVLITWQTVQIPSFTGLLAAVRECEIAGWHDMGSSRPLSSAFADENYSENPWFASVDKSFANWISHLEFFRNYRKTFSGQSSSLLWIFLFLDSMPFKELNCMYWLLTFYARTLNAVSCLFIFRSTILACWRRRSATLDTPMSRWSRQFQNLMPRESRRFVGTVHRSSGRWASFVLASKHLIFFSQPQFLIKFFVVEGWRFSSLI